MLPGLGSGVWVGIGYGLFGVVVWVVGLYVFYRVISRVIPDEQVD